MRPPPEARDPGAEHRALAATIDLIGRDHPTASIERVEVLLRSCYERTSDAKVQQYRIVLAERHTRTQLRLEERAAEAFRPRHSSSAAGPHSGDEQIRGESPCPAASPVPIGLTRTS